MAERKEKPQRWSRKGRCPSCDVGTGSKHKEACTFDYGAQKKKSVASVETHGPVTVGASGVIRWGDVMTIQGYEVSVSKAVELGLKHKIHIAELLERDLKSESGLLITFPMAMLMDKLQRIEEIGTGPKLLKLVKA